MDNSSDSERQRGFNNRMMDERMDICDSKVTFPTENENQKQLKFRICKEEKKEMIWQKTKQHFAPQTYSPKCLEQHIRREKDMLKETSTFFQTFFLKKEKDTELFKQN